jgi:Biopolymer transport proteins
MFTLSSIAIVNGTLWILLGFSVITWSVILSKVWQHLRGARYNRTFTKMFWSAPDLRAAANLSGFTGPAARLAQAGFTALHEADTVTSHDLQHSGDQQDFLERCLRQQMQKERSDMENGLTLLASIGSTAPFVGLFGTVWGIMHALQDISKSGSASLDVVAGPIGEALLATAIGIAVALPAVLAYNFFLRRMKMCVADLEDFATDFLHLVIKAKFKTKEDQERWLFPTSPSSRR